MPRSINQKPITLYPTREEANAIEVEATRRGTSTNQLLLAKLRQPWLRRLVGKLRVRDRKAAG
jgi:hypothetical protein